MKSFLHNLLICLILCAVGTFFFGYLLLSNIWVLTVFVAFFFAILITIFVSQDARIERLEKEVKQLLEGKTASSDDEEK